MTDSDLQWCPYGEDGKGGGCIKTVKPGESHDGPHMVVASGEDDD